MSRDSLGNIFYISDNIRSMKISSQKLVSMVYTIHEGSELLENVDTPVSFIYGKETSLLPIVEKSLNGKEAGDELTIEVSPELGFGEIDNSLIFVDSVSNVPKEYSKIGMQIDFENEKGQRRKFRVTKIEGDNITFDGNHPFSGKILIYKIKITDVAETEAVKA